MCKTSTQSWLSSLLMESLPRSWPSFMDWKLRFERSSTKRWTFLNICQSFMKMVECMEDKTLGIVKVKLKARPPINRMLAWVMGTWARINKSGTRASWGLMTTRITCRCKNVQIWSPNIIIFMNEMLGKINASYFYFHGLIFKVYQNFIPSPFFVFFT
jgi:hypothetical protein